MYVNEWIVREKFSSKTAPDTAFAALHFDSLLC